MFGVFLEGFPIRFAEADEGFCFTERRRVVVDKYGDGKMIRVKCGDDGVVEEERERCRDDGDVWRRIG